MEEDQTTFRTINSAYLLDRQNGRWERLQNLGDTDPVAPLRTESGELWAHHDIVVGEPAVFYGPTLTKLESSPPLVPLRRVTTSIVTEILAGSDLAWNLERLREKGE